MSRSTATRFGALALLVLAGCLGEARGAGAPGRGTAMVEVPAGCLTLGTSPAVGSQKPREVCLPAFRIDRSEVTVAAYAACVEAGACKPVGKGRPRCNSNVAGRDEHPVNCVGYDEAVSFCRWRGARLPGEDEWERAARGPKGTLYPWGDEAPTPERAAYFQHIKQITSPVCSHPAGNSAEGVCDLAGNVSEWVAGYWDRDREEAPLPEPKRRPKEGARVSHGGSIAGPIKLLLGSKRQYVNLGDEIDHGQGFRCAADVPSR